MFSGFIVLPDSKETELEGATKRFLHQQVKYWGKFSSMLCMEVCHYVTAISGGVDIPEVSGCHLLRQMCSQ